MMLKLAMIAQALLNTAQVRALLYSKPFCSGSLPVLTTFRQVTKSRHHCNRQRAWYTLSRSLDELDLTSAPNRDRNRWLVVGDGDLSYSAALSQAINSNNIDLVATVLEDEQSHNTTYKNSLKSAETIASNDHTVMFEVDATKLTSYFGRGRDTKDMNVGTPQSFDRIIFNFPHWPGKANIRRNRLLIREFLQSASMVLSLPHGEISIALLQKQGGMSALTMTDYRASWLVAEYAAEAGLVLKRIERFGDGQLYNQSSRRGVDRAFSLGDDPEQYIFGFPSSDYTIDEDLQLACRHEVHVALPEHQVSILQSTSLDTKTTPSAHMYSDKEYITRDELLVAAQAQCPAGIRASIVQTEEPKYYNGLYPTVVSLVVYTGEQQPLTRQRADDIRARLEVYLTQEVKVQLTKEGRMVSKILPRRLLETIIDTAEEEV